VIKGLSDEERMAFIINLATINGRVEALIAVKELAAMNVYLDQNITTAVIAEAVTRLLPPESFERVYGVRMES